MTIRVLFPHHWQTQAWKNGGGITHEIARADDEHGNRWRLSIAEVASDGPFSCFENIDRVILMLDGKGFCLHGVGANPEVIAEPLKPFSFAGEAAIDCTLLVGPVRDFNLMSRRGAVQASLQVLALSEVRQSLPLAAQTFVYVASGRVFAEINQHGYLLDQQQTLCIDAESGPLLLSGAQPGTQALLISIR